jgi:hypothetical protein
LTEEQRDVAKELWKLDASGSVSVKTLCARTGLSEPELREVLSALARISWRIDADGALQLVAETLQ